MSKRYPVPTPIFDTLENIVKQQQPSIKPISRSGYDFRIVVDFLKQYNGSVATFTAYRREMERILQWSWLIAKKSILKLKRDDIEDYIKFCQKPPLSWIGLKQVTRFVG